MSHSAPLRLVLPNETDFERTLIEFGHWLVRDCGRSVNTERAYWFTMRRMATMLAEQGNITLENATTRNLRLALRQIDKASTRARYVHALRTYYRFLRVESLRDDNPAEQLESPRVPRRLPRPMPPEEWERYMRAAFGLGRKHYVFACLGTFAGLRISEACGLEWSRISGESLRVVGKGDKERQVPMAQHLQTALWTWRKECPSPSWVFPRSRPGSNPDGGRWRDKPVTRQSAGKDLHRRILGRCGLPLRGYGYHRLRHTFATEALRVSGGDLRAVQELLGHENITTTAVYTLVSNPRLAAVVAELFPLAERITEGGR